MYLGDQRSSMGQESYLIQPSLPPGSTPMPLPPHLPPPPTGIYISPNSKGPHDISAAVNKVLLDFLKKEIEKLPHSTAEGHKNLF